MARPMPALLYEARRVLELHSQGSLGQFLGSSARSGQRWERAQSRPTSDQLRKLAGAVHARDPALAEEIAECDGTSLLQLGIVAPPPPPAPLPLPTPPALLPPDPAFLVDTVVCAAAEAIDVMPAEIRPALRAAFRRARLARLSVEDIDTALALPDKPQASKR
jgi:hypothetical protein